MAKAPGDDSEFAQESDALPSDLGDEDDEEGSSEDAEDLFDDDSDDGELEGDDDEEEGEERGSSQGEFSLAEGSQDDDLLPMESDGSTCSGEEWAGIGDRKRKRSDDGARRKKSKVLHTFASYEEYAKRIEEGPEDNL